MNSLLYDLIETKILGDYREKLEKEQNDNFSMWMRETREKLEKALNAEQLKLVDEYKHCIDLRNEDISIQTSVKLLNYCIKIGMQLQQAFYDDENI